MSEGSGRRIDALLRRVSRLERPTAPAPSDLPSDDRLTPYFNDPCGFAEQLVDPDTGVPFVLYPAERRFLADAFTVAADGRLAYPELLFAAPKKSGKTTLAAIALLYVVRVIGGRHAEGLCVANDFDQAAGRVFRQAGRIVEGSPLLRGTGTVTADRIAFQDGASITALPSNYAVVAGANPSLVVFDELWAYTSERAHRLWDELVPVPTRRVSGRFTVTYAGFEGEGDILNALYARGLKGEEVAPALRCRPGLLMFWSHDPVAPWQTPAWLAQMREQLRPSAYLRMIENRFVTSEASFVDLDWWDRCVHVAQRPVLVDRGLPVWVGVDASVKRDATAIVAVTFERATQRVRLVWHRTFQPSPEDPLDFESTVERTVRGLRDRFLVRQVAYDPYQFVAVAQRLARAGLPMVEVAQTVPALTEIGTLLYELIKGGNLAVYPDPDLRLAISQAVARESARGWVLAKQHATHRIDVVVALALAASAAVAAQASTYTVGGFKFSL